ncbi:Toxoplasma gondii family A protein [Toxoplasma gondii ARI]|uniref:Toxoplasma gondii family A protein n=1 Tax=Toxoplasma gondii ARI TaxID=1074872 RepID=A0A139XNX6_TOXGO|nr:Toxoplasma gondii family A protein [Toxoplasma gondii ARI]
MKGQIRRAVCLTLLVGTVISCYASETNEHSGEADFITTIPKTGLIKNVEQVFSLGPSSTLRVVDDTGKAIYLPKATESTDQNSPETYTTAYPYRHGGCDFTEKILFKDVFPGYQSPLWVREESDSESIEKGSSAKSVVYTFTNPSAQYLGRGLSFCVRFKTVLPSGSSFQTSTPSPSSSGSAGLGNSDSSVEPPSPTPEEEEEKKVFPTDDTAGDGGSSSPSGENVSQPGGAPDSQRDKDSGNHHTEGGPSDSVEAAPPPGSVPDSSTGVSPPSLPENQSPQSPGGQGEHSAGAGSGVGENHEDTEEQESQQDHAAGNKGDVNAQTLPGETGDSANVPKLPNSDPEVDPLNPKADAKPAISDEEKVTGPKQRESPEEVPESKQDADTPRKEGSDVTKVGRTDKESNGHSDLPNKEEPAGFLSRLPVSPPSTDAPSYTLAHSSAKQEQEDINDVQSDANEQEPRTEPGVHPSASDVEPRPSQPVEEAHETNGDLANGPAVSADEKKSSSVSLPHTAGNVVASTQPHDHSMMKNIQVRERLNEPIEAGEESRSSTGDQNGARVRRLNESATEKETYLTIIVHSTALGVAGGISGLSVLVLALAATQVAATYL